MSIGARLYSKQQAGLCVQASNWKAAVPLNMIGWCWESYHKLLLYSLRNNLETLVLLRV